MMRMRKIAVWFLLSCKRYLKKGAFLWVLLVFPLLALAVSGAEKTGDDRIRIAVYAQEAEEYGSPEKGDSLQDSLERQLAEKLVSREQTGRQGMFSFYLCENEEQVREDVASRRAECGYVISSGLREKLNSRSFKRSISVYTAPSTVTASLSAETVFAALMELYDREILEDYAAEGPAFEQLGEPGSELRKEAAVKAGQLYGKWLNNGSTFRFEYRYEDDLPKEGAGGNAGEGNHSLFPVRGLAAVYIFAAGLYGAVMLGKDEEKGLFLPLDHSIRIWCKGASLAACTALAAVSGFLALQAGGVSGSFFTEAGALICYAIAVTLFSLALKAVFRSPRFLCCTIPFFIIGSLVFCPVFVDAGRFFPEFDTAGKLFLPYYYLRFFTGGI